LIEGVVRGATGEPVAEALLSLVPADPNWEPSTTPPTTRVRTSADGRFRIEGAPAGSYALNVTAPGFITTYRTGLQLGADQRLQNQEVKLEAGGVVLQGTVKRRDGRPVAEAWVGAARESSELGDIAYVRADANGAFSIQVAPGGEYTLYAQAPGHTGSFSPVPVEATPGGVPPQELQLTPLPVETPPPAEVVDWLKKAAVPLASVEAGHGFKDLKPLEPWVSKARVVALGSATHGTREFFQLKHRMLEWLATEQGFTLFAIEASFAEALALNDYVLTGKGEPGAALSGLHSWEWDTEEVLALIQWMRAYNADPKHPRKLKFYGFDMRLTPGSTKALLAYFQKVDAPFGRTLEEPLKPLVAKASLEPRSQPTPEQLAAVRAHLTQAQQRLEAQRASYVRKSSERDWAFARRHASLLAYVVDMAGGSPAEVFAGRDRIMAENVRWLLEQEGPGVKMVVWAHNGHVSTREPHPSTSMGRHLREALGDSLYVFGLTFNQGAFRARQLLPGQPPGGVIVQHVPPAPPGALDAALASAGLPLFALDLRGAPREGPVATFLHEPRKSRQIGSVYGEGYPEETVTLAEEFDGVLFVEKSTATTPVPISSSQPPPQKTGQ
jgi:erythromycin esterase